MSSVLHMSFRWKLRALAATRDTAKTALTLKVLNFCTSLTLHPPSPPTMHQLSRLALSELKDALGHISNQGYHIMGCIMNIQMKRIIMHSFDIFWMGSSVIYIKRYNTKTHLHRGFPTLYENLSSCRFKLTLTYNTICYQGFTQKHTSEISTWIHKHVSIWIHKHVVCFCCFSAMQINHDGKNYYASVSSLVSLVVIKAHVCYLLGGAG